MRRLLIAIIALLPLAAVAQEGAYAKRVGEPKQLPGQVSSVVTFDGDIYVSVDGLLMRIHESDGEVAYVLPDTLPVPSERKAEYVTRQPKSGVVYFTKTKMFGKHVLYRIVQKENGKQVAEKVKPGGRSISIETPAFSPDGNFMVFVSKELRGFGGYDVYISEWGIGGWGAPLNIGEQVNGKGNETTPFFVDDYLVYATNGNADGYGGYDFYASKMKKYLNEDGSVARVTFLRPQHLPVPLSSEEDDRAMTVSGKKVYLGSDRDSAEMGDRLYVYECELDGFMLTGVVTDMRDRPQARAMITVREGGVEVASAQTDFEGRYVVYLRKNRSYEVIFSKIGFGMDKLRLYTERKDESTLFYKMTHDVKLESFEPGQYMELEGLFGSDAAVELTAEGRKKLQSVAGFLMVNPHAPVAITMYCNVSGDKEFNMLVAEQRVVSVKKFLKSNAPKADRYTVQNGGEYASKENKNPRNDLMTVTFGNF